VSSNGDFLIVCSPLDYGVTYRTLPSLGPQFPWVSLSWISQSKVQRTASIRSWKEAEGISRV